MYGKMFIMIVKLKNQFTLTQKQNKTIEILQCPLTWCPVVTVRKNKEIYRECSVLAELLPYSTLCLDSGTSGTPSIGQRQTAGSKSENPQDIGSTALLTWRQMSPLFSVCQDHYRTHLRRCSGPLPGDDSAVCSEKLIFFSNHLMMPIPCAK